MTRFAWNLEIDMIVILILAFIIVKSIRSNNIYSLDIMFRVTLYCDILLAIMDAVWAAITNGIISVPLWVAYGVNIIYLWDLALIGYFWFIYSESLMNMKWTKITKMYFIFAIPELVLLILLVTSYWSGIIFSVTPDFIYNRGPLLPLASAIDIVYPTITCFRSLSRSFKKKYYVNSEEYRNMAGFIIFPAIGTGLVIMDANAPYLASSIMLALVFTFFSIENTIIQTDPLTNLPNRRKLYPYVDTIIEKHNDFSLKDFYFILVEITNLKTINEQYGNKEGDHALILLADVIKRVCRDYSAYGARYSDNRFCVALETEEPDEINHVMAEIEKMLSDVESTKFKIDFKYAYARYDTVTMDCVKAIVEVAEERIKDRERDLNP